jgi:chloride channel protein, CIC family
MSAARPMDTGTVRGDGSLLALALLSLLVGAAAGLIGSVFRLCLEQADLWREQVIAWGHVRGMLGLPVVCGLCAAATAIAAWLVRRYSPDASGSGIPHVEAVLEGEVHPAPPRLIPVKFFGGLLAIGAGLALGREGPSVQMGASTAHLLGKLFRRSGWDCRVLLAAGAGAGLATAFNAPIAGAVFVLEELARRFDTRIAIATFGATTSAIAVARLLLGEEPDFPVDALPYPGFGTVPVNLVLGILAGLLGVAYNRTILGALALAERTHRWPVEQRAAVVGAAVGLLAWFLPNLVGGGDDLTQVTLQGGGMIQLLPWIFLLRFALGPLSYSAGTPGGLFAPMLVLGSQSGRLFGELCQHWLPGVTADPTAFAVTGMAAFFTASVRAPITAITLAVGLTGTHTQLLPMLGACFTAMLVPTLLHSPPIYDSLRPQATRPPP